MELLTVEETAAMLRVSKVTVRRFIADGRLPAVKVGRAVRVEKADAERVAQPATPKAPMSRPTSRKYRGTQANAVAALRKLVGIAGYDPNAPTDVSENKYKYLAEAYEDTPE